MARNITGMKRGWNYDYPNTALKAMVDGVKGFQLIKDSVGQYAIMMLGLTPTATAAGQVDGRGVTLTGSRTCALEVNADTGSTDLAGDYYVSGIKGNVVMGTASSNASIIGVLGKLNTNTANFGSGQHFAVRGHLNIWGSATIAGAGDYTGALSAYMEHEGTTTVSAANVLCGIDVYSVGGTVSNSGTHAGIYIRSNTSTAAWQYGIYIPIAAAVSASPSEAAIQVGDPTRSAAGQVDGKSFACTSSRSAACEIHADTGSTNLAGDYYVSSIFGDFILGTTSSNATIIGVLGKLNTNTANFGSGQHFAVRGHLNFWGNSTLAGVGNYTGAISAYIENEATTTVSAGNYLIGVDILQVGAPTVSGDNPAILIRSNTSGAKWKYGIYMPVMGADEAVRIGTQANTDGSGLPLSSTHTSIFRVFTDTGSTDITGTDVRGGLFRHCIGTTQTNCSINALRGQIVIATGCNTGSGNVYGLRGYMEIKGTTSITGADGHAGAIHAYLENAGTTTVASGAYLSGIDVLQVGAPTVTATGHNSGILIRADSAAASWQHGIYINQTHLVTGENAILIDTTFTGTGAFAHKAIESNVVYTPSTAGSGGSVPVAVAAKVTLSAGCTSTLYMWAMQAQLDFADTSTYNGSQIAALRAVLTNTGTTTWTGGKIAGIYIDNLIDDDIMDGAQRASMMRIANNGGKMDDIFEIYFSSKTYNLFNFTDAGDQIFTDISSGGVHGGTIQRVRCELAGTTYYMIISTDPTVA